MASAAYLARARETGGRPVLGSVAHCAIRVARLERDAEYSNQWGATREDIQNARKIIGEGKGWVDRLESAMKAGAILPALRFAILGDRS
jgi:hypothetical protein